MKIPYLMASKKLKLGQVFKKIYKRFKLQVASEVFFLSDIHNSPNYQVILTVTYVLKSWKYL